MTARWYNENSIESVIASTFARGKGRLFEMFFGWRENRKGENKFVFSDNDWEQIDEEIEYYKKFVKNS